MSTSCVERPHRPRNPSRSGRFARLAIALGLLLPACAREEGEPTRIGPDVVTLARGSGEPRPVRYAIEKGDVQTVHVTTRLGMIVQYGEEILPAADMPPTRATLANDVVEAGDGFTHRFEITTCEILPAGDDERDGGSDPERLAAILADLDGQTPVGLSGEVTRAGTGAIVAVDFEIPRGANGTVRHVLGNLEQALHQLAVPFPSDPIAPGARWSVSCDVDVNQMRLAQQTEYLLERIESDGTLIVGVQSTLRGAPQLLRLPNMPATSRCELIEATADATGSLSARLDRPLPIEGQITMRVQMHALIHPEGAPSQEIGGLVTMTIRVET